MQVKHSHIQNKTVIEAFFFFFYKFTGTCYKPMIRRHSIGTFIIQIRDLKLISNREIEFGSRDYILESAPSTTLYFNMSSLLDISIYCPPPKVTFTEL